MQQLLFRFVMHSLICTDTLTLSGNAPQLYCSTQGMFGFSSLFKRNTFSETTLGNRKDTWFKSKLIWWSLPRIWNWDRDASFCEWLELRWIKWRLRRHPMQGEMEKVQQSEKRSQGLGEDRKTHSFQAFVDPIPHESLCPWILRWPWEVNIHHF